MTTLQPPTVHTVDTLAHPKDLWMPSPELAAQISTYLGSAEENVPLLRSIIAVSNTERHRFDDDPRLAPAAVQSTRMRDLIAAIHP